MLATTFPAKDGDGTPGFVLTLAKGLQKTADVTVLVPRIPGGARTESIDGVQVIRFPYFIRRFEKLADGAILPNINANRWLMVQAPFLVLSMLYYTVKLCRETKYDVVNAHWIVPSAVCARFAKLFTKVPYITTILGADAFALNGRIGTWLKRYGLGGAASNLSMSADIANHLRIKRGKVIPLGVDLQEAKREVGERAPVANSVLFVGRLADKKGIDLLIRALEQLPNATLTIVGDGPEGQLLRDLADKLGVSSRTTFLGKQTRAQVYGHMKIAAVVAIPSRMAPNGDRDGTPVVLMESMAAKVPVVVSRIGGLAEQITDGQSGIIIEPENVDELVAALNTLLSDPALGKKYADAAYEQAMAELNVDVTAERYQQVIDEVTGTA